MELNKEQMAQALELLGKLQSGPAQKWLPDEKYFAQFNSALDWAKKCIQDDGSAPHTFYLWGRQREGEEWIMQPIMFGDWPPPENKYTAMQGLGAMFVDTHPDYMLMNIVHVSEGWMANYAQEDNDPDGNPYYLRKGIPYPSERKDRIECLIVSATSMDQRISYTNLPMIRNAAGEFEKWGEPMESLYKEGEPSNPRERADFLAINVLFGYFAASKAAR